MGVARVRKCQKNCGYCDCIQQVKDEIIDTYGYDLTDIFSVEELEKQELLLHKVS